MERPQVVDTVANGVVGRQASFLIEMPPCCESHQVLRGIQKTILTSGNENLLVCSLSVDRFPSEDAMVHAMVQEWMNSNIRIAESCKRFKSTSAPRAIDNLLEFAQFASDEGYGLIAIIYRFDRIFRCMSGELLATLRDLEHGRQLATVNASPRRYAELYQIRSQEEPNFVSEYGQSHARIALGRLAPADSEALWRDQLGVDLDEGSARAKFRLAVEESGAFEGALHMAGQLLFQDPEGELSVPEYRELLTKELPDSFQRLVSYLGGEESGCLEALARLHLGTAQGEEIAKVRAHRWRQLLLDESDLAPTISCAALGQSAVQYLAQSDSVWAMRASAADAYETGQFERCMRLAEGESNGKSVLFEVARMMYEIYRDNPRALYFRSNVQWRKVQRWASELVARVENNDAKEEFKKWEELARAHDFRENSRKGIETQLSEIGNDDGESRRAIILILGVRLIAVERDQSTVAASYVAIPLVEELLRTYVVFALESKPVGSAFDAVDDDEIDSWFPLGGEFCRPKSDDRPLTATNLAVLAAALSAKKGRALFSDRAEVSKMLSALDTVRNLPSHYVASSNEKQFTRWLDLCKNLFEKLCEDSQCGFSYLSISKYIEIPRAFLSISTNSR